MHIKTPLPAVTLKLVTHNFLQLLESVARCCRMAGGFPGRERIIPCAKVWSRLVSFIAKYCSNKQCGKTAQVGLAYSYFKHKQKSV